MPPLPTIVNDMDMDLYEMLDKQIEEIRSSVDASKNKNIDAKLGFEEQVKGSLIAVTNASESNIQVLPDQNYLRRSTRNRKKLQREVEVNDPPAPTSSIQEELGETRSPLNPLAACAALASLMSNSPQKLGFSFYQDSGKCVTNPPDVEIHNQDAMQPSGETVSAVTKPDIILKSLFSTSHVSETHQILDTSSEILIEGGNKGQNTEVSDLTGSSTWLMSGNNMSQSRAVTRLRCTASKKVDSILDDSIEKRAIIDGEELSSATIRRFTRSSIQKEEKRQTMETRKVVDDDISTKLEKTNYGYNVTEKECVLSTVDAKIDHKALVIEKHTLSNMRKLTRSAVRKQKTNISMETSRGSGVAIAEHRISESSAGYVRNMDINMQETRDPVTLPLHVDIILPPPEETHKKTQAEREIPFTEEKAKIRKTYSAAKTTQETEVNVKDGDESSQCRKRKSTTSKKQDIRFSARLKFLPRLRSRNKA